MDRTLKVIASKSEQAALARDHTVTANYDAFALVQVNETEARELSQRYLVEDITAQYEIPLGPAATDSIDTNLPRITGPARPSAHPLPFFFFLLYYFSTATSACTRRA